jgi:hypothetical protein
MTERKLSRIEALLQKVRRKPSLTCRDTRQLDLEDIIKSRAFAELDASIERAMVHSGRESHH